MEELLQVKGVGPQVAGSIREFSQNPKNRALLQKLLDAGVQPQGLEKSQAAPLAGKTFVFTGGLQKISREEAKALVTALGGKVASSVSAKTDYVVVGQDPGSKYAKAMELDLSILDEAGFENLVGRKA
jgi:DNA ligase (NAD+)